VPFFIAVFFHPQDLEKALYEAKRLEARLRKFIDTVFIPAWGNLPDGSNEFLNQRWHGYADRPPQEAYGWGVPGQRLQDT
jgi:hypothetical protein